MPESHEEVGVFRALDYVLGELAEIEVERDEVVNVGDGRNRLALTPALSPRRGRSVGGLGWICDPFGLCRLAGEVGPDTPVLLAASNDFAPGFGWEREFGRGWFVPRLSEFDKAGIRGVQASGDFWRQRQRIFERSAFAWMAGDVMPGRAMADGGINVAVGVGLQEVPNGGGVEWPIGGLMDWWGRRTPHPGPLP